MDVGLMKLFHAASGSWIYEKDQRIRRSWNDDTCSSMMNMFNRTSTSIRIHR